MTFSEKLTFLLNLSGATNAELANAADIDPSQVSRLKNGSRNIPKKIRTVELMADFFAFRCTSDYQRSAVADATGERRILTDTNPRLYSETICSWMRSRKSESNLRMDTFMRTFESYDRNARMSSGQEPITVGEGSETSAKSYFGNEGRRSAVVEVIQHLRDFCKPCEVYLLSDENLDWLVQEPGFNSTIIAMMLDLAEKGFSIKRISCTFNDSSLAIESLERWFPLYMTGRLSSYYYPRMRDGLFRRFMVIAPGIFSLTSSALGDQHECGATYLSFNRHTIDDDCHFFNCYLNRCVPLTESCLFENDPGRYCQQLLTFHNISSDGISKWMALPYATMPGTILSDFEIASNDPRIAEMLHMLRLIQESFEETLREGHSVCEIIRPYPAEQVLSGKASLWPSPMIPGSNHFYTPEEYRLHLMRILSLMDKYPNYFVIVDEGDMPVCELHVKQNHSVLMRRNTTPAALFFVTEHHTVSACCEYLMMNATRYGSSLVIQRRRTTEKLRAIYNALS